MSRDPDEIMRQEHRRHQIIEKALSAAGRILVDEADGSVEEIDYLTTEIMHRWVDKVVCASRARLLKKDLLERSTGPLTADQIRLED
jgi:hypothetical protein